MELFKKNIWIFNILLGITFGSVATIVVLKYRTMKIFEFSTENLIVLSMIIICFSVIKFIRDAGLKADKKLQQPLGMPAGTVRATIALVLIVFFALIAMYAILVEPKEGSSRLVENILTTLATLVISAVSFYFGVKATEQGSEIANRIFGEVSKSGAAETVPAMVIQEALKQNKDKWIKEYGCRDIRLGKKHTSDGQVNLDCLVFFVDKKLEPSTLGETSTTPIPSTISFDFQGKPYSIPTDVRPYSEAEGQQPSTTGHAADSDFTRLSPDAQKGIIREFIKHNSSNLINKYPEIQGISDFKKIVDGSQKSYYAIQFTVAVKQGRMSSADEIPKFFSYTSESGANYLIPTDVIGEGELHEAIWDGTGISPKELGLSISRAGSDSTGTIGLKVFREGAYHALTCCHVLFRDETSRDPSISTHNSSGVDIISPGKKDAIAGKETVLGNISRGWYDDYLDIALAKLNDPDSLENKLFKQSQTPTPSGVIALSEKDNNSTEVELYGRTSHRKTGRIYDYFKSATFIGENKRLVQDLIVCELKSDPGDSGAIVVEKSKKQIVGIAIATSDRFTYVISIEKIIKKLDLKKENNPWFS